MAKRDAATPRAAIILAAGKSSRMQSARSKVLHTLGGRSLLAWVGAYVRDAGIEKVVCIISPDGEDVRAEAQGLGFDIAIQEAPLGTGHAVQAAEKALEGFTGDLVVLFGDTPLIRAETLDAVFNSLQAGADISVLGFEPDDPGAYGRLIEQDGQLQAIVEAKDASPDELAIGFCNSGVMAANADVLFAALDKVGNDNAKGEYYLTDCVGILRGAGKTAQTVRAEADEVLGINSRADLALAEAAFQKRMRQQAISAGVTLRDPETVMFSHDTVLAPDTDIGAHVVFGPGVTVATGSIVHPFSHLEGAQIGENVQIGPFARLRPGTNMARGSKVGNFVEVKNAQVGEGSKINHLSYVGDAELGEAVNVGAGVITCNYDGYFKHKTVIGHGAFIGTNSSLVAPVNVGDGAYIGSGSVITTDVAKDSLALGRARQSNKEGWAVQYRAGQEKRKEQKRK